MMPSEISIIGCGWLGLPLAERLLADGYRVKGSATSAEKVDFLKQKGIDAFQLQLMPNPVGNLDTLLDADVLIMNIPPKAGMMGDSFHPQQTRYVVDAVRNSRIRYVVYVSSTSIYPDLNRVVVEDDVTNVSQAAAPAMVEAETLVQSLAPERQVAVLRYGGLLGYNRNPGRYVAGRNVTTGGVPVNFIHRNDAVGILHAVIQQPISGTFNVVAPQHPLRKDIYVKCCSEFGYEIPTFVTPNEPVPYKIISPEKLLRTIEYSFEYPDPLQFFYTA